MWTRERGCRAVVRERALLGVNPPRLWARGETAVEGNARPAAPAVLLRRRQRSDGAAVAEEASDTAGALAQRTP